MWIGVQKADRPTPLEIANDRAVALVSPPCPIIDADDDWGGTGGQPRRLTTRRSVSLLTGSISRRAKLAAGRPRNARPR